MRTPYAKPQVKKREVTRPNANTHCLQDSSAALHRRPSVGSGKAREAEPTCYADGGSCEARHDSRGRRELWGKSKLCAAVIKTEATRYLTVQEGPTRVLRNDGGEDHAGKDNEYTVRGINRRAVYPAQAASISVAKVSLERDRRLRLGVALHLHDRAGHRWQGAAAGAALGRPCANIWRTV